MLLPTLPGMDQRSMALSLAVEGEDPTRERDRVETLPRVFRELERVFGPCVPSELAVLVTAHPERARVLHRAALLSQEPFAAWVFGLDPGAAAGGGDATQDHLDPARQIAG